MPDGTLSRAVLFDTASLKTERDPVDSSVQRALASVHWTIADRLHTRKPVGVAVYQVMDGKVKRVGYDCIGSPTAQAIVNACDEARNRLTNQPYSVGIVGLVSTRLKGWAEGLIRGAIDYEKSREAVAAE